MGPLQSVSSARRGPTRPMQLRGAGASCQVPRARQRPPPCAPDQRQMRVRMQLPAPLTLRLLGARARALLGALRRNSAQLIVLGATSAALALAMHHSQWDLVAEVAEKAAGGPGAVSLETWLACMALSSMGRVLMCGGFCFLTARHFDKRVADSDDVLAVLHARQAALRRFAEAVLEEMGAQGGRHGQLGRGAGRQGAGGRGVGTGAGAGSGGEGGELPGEHLAAFGEWFLEQLEMQDLILGSIMPATLDPQQRMLHLLARLGLSPDGSSLGKGEEDEYDVLGDWSETGMTWRRRRRSAGRAGKGSDDPSVPLSDRPQHSMGGSVGGAGWRRRAWRDDHHSSLEKDRARLERLLQQRSPSEQRERDDRHHELFMSHLREMQRRMERVMGLPPPPPRSLPPEEGEAPEQGGGSGREGRG